LQPKTSTPVTTGSVKPAAATAGAGASASGTYQWQTPAQQDAIKKATGIDVRALQKPSSGSATAMAGTSSTALKPLPTLASTGSANTTKSTVTAGAGGTDTKPLGNTTSSTAANASLTGMNFGSTTGQKATGNALVLPQNGQLPSGLKPLNGAASGNSSKSSAATTVNPSSFSVTRTSSTVIPANKDNYGSVKGTMQFTDRNGKTHALEAKSNGAFEGNTEGKGTYQCTELVKRYGKDLGLNIDKTGDGKVAAATFADKSNGQFTYVASTSARGLPAPGAVISFDDPSKGPGHVAIIQDINKRTDGTYVARLFDQNYPRSNGQWKEVEFKQSNGVWQGYFTNTSPTTKEVTKYTATGWANPN
jgi:CHAP domain